MIKFTGLKKTNYVKTTYNKLKELKEAAKLKPGTYYCFEYETKHIIPNTNIIHTGNTEELVILATGSGTFSTNAYSLQNYIDEIDYDFNANYVENGSEPRKGFITRRKDMLLNNEVVGFDFKNFVTRITDDNEKFNLFLFEDITNINNYIVADVSVCNVSFLGEFFNNKIYKSFYNTYFAPLKSFTNNIVYNDIRNTIILTNINNCIFYNIVESTRINNTILDSFSCKFIINSRVKDHIILYFDDEVWVTSTLEI